MIPYVILFAIYVIGLGATFTMLGEKYSPNDYWESPAPFFGSLFWPVFIPASLGSGIGKRLMGDASSRTNRKIRKREREIEQAQHELELASIRAKTTEELEKALR